MSKLENLCCIYNELFYQSYAQYHVNETAFMLF